MKPSQHVALSLVSGTALGLAQGSWVAGTACAAIGILIDADHLVDFWIERGFSLNPRKFFDFCYRGTSRKFYDILHGYEFIPVWWALPAAAGLDDLAWGLAVGYALHLLGDQLGNRHLHRWTYFLTFRAWHRFEWKKIVLQHPSLDGPRA